MIIIREGQKLLALSSEIIIYKEKLKTYVGVSVFFKHFMSSSGLKKEEKGEVVIKVGVHDSIT